MTRADIGDIPQAEPLCAMWGTDPVSGLDRAGRRPRFLSRKCHACGYRFEAVAIFEEHPIEHPPLAA